MRFLIRSFLIGIVVCSCQPKYKAWVFDSEVSLINISPIGITKNSTGYWISDGDNNRVIQLDHDLQIIEKLDGFDRPMHLASHDETIYIPEYGSDKISVIKLGKIDSLKLPFKLDAPAGIDVKGKEVAVADFYNHRILFFNGNDWIEIGKEGHGLGELYYSTDVQIMSDKIVVADAYNNRIQLFSKGGKVLKEIGGEQKINAATGVYATKNEIYVTDFENDRVLVFDYEGSMLQELTEGLEKPTDILVDNDQLLIINYKGKSVSKYNKG